MTGRRHTTPPLILRCAVIAALTCVVATAQQAIVDPDFKPVLTTASYTQRRPIVAIDETHANLYTAAGRYKPLADLLTSDGYQVVGSRRPFEGEALNGIDVLVIAIPPDLAGTDPRERSPKAFSEAECRAVRDWVRAGGSLLLVADHGPSDGGAANLVRQFGVTIGGGWVFDRVTGGGITTELEFSRQNRLLDDHVILKGRGPAETISRIRSFTGQSLSVPSDAAVLMRLSSTAREAATAAELDAEDVASRQEADIAGSRSVTAADRAQGIALTFGRGRLVVLGAAAMLSAQIAHSADGHNINIGMNVPRTDNQQFALNVMHWLSRLLN